MTKVKYSPNTWLKCKIKIALVQRIYNISKQCAFVHVEPKNITMRCPNLVQNQSKFVSHCTVVEHPMGTFLGST